MKWTFPADPKITLGLSAGSAGPLSDFGHKDTTSWSLGPLISWSIPDTGAVQARIEQAEASTRGALAHFDGTVLTALRETETALDAERSLAASEAAPAASQAQLADDQISLFLALGGGWEPAGHP